MEVRVLLPQPFGAWDCVAWSSPWQGEFQAGATPAGSTIFRVASFNREAGRLLTGRTRSITEAAHQLARWRSRQRSSLIRRRSRVRIPLEPPFLSKRGRAAIAARCKRAALAGCEGASPSASTILPAKRRQRRIPLVSGRAERKSPCRIQFSADVAEQ